MLKMGQQQQLIRNMNSNVSSIDADDFEILMEDPKTLFLHFKGQTPFFMSDDGQGAFVQLTPELVLQLGVMLIQSVTLAEFEVVEDE